MNKYNLNNRLVSYEEARKVRDKALRQGKEISIIDPAVDSAWAKLHSDSQAPNPYFQYFYTGQDIKAYIAEIGDEGEFADMPIQSIQFNVSQNKQPVYGYASYTYDAVMRGTRIVSGNFTLVTRHPGYMRRALAAAASARARGDSRGLKDNPGGRKLTADDANIEKFWASHIEAGMVTNNEFSIHPPFNLVIQYGLQDTSVTQEDFGKQFDGYREDNTLFADQNQRLVEGYSDRPDKFIIEACELQGMQVAHSPDGSVAMEMYDFFGRDIIVPSPTIRNRNRLRLTPGGGGSSAHRPM